MLPEKFQETEIGLIPEDWETGNINDVSTVKGRIGWRGYTKNDLSLSGPLVLGATQISKNNEIDLSKPVFISREKYEESPEIKLNKHDILIVKVGNTIGKVAIIREEIGEATLNPNCVVLKNVKIDNYFLFYFLLTKQAQHYLINASAASAQPAINQKDIKLMTLPIPPLDQQKKISFILSSLDQKIQLNNHMNHTLEEISQAVFRYWFVHFEFPDENGQPYKSSGGDMVDSELGEIPVGWSVKKLKDTCNITMGQSPKSEFYNEECEGLPFHQGVTNFRERFPKDKIYCTLENKIAGYGDILFSVRAPVGRINIAKSKMVIGRGLSAIRHKKDFQSFLLYQLKNIFTEEDSIGSGTVFNAITRKDLDDLNVIVPNEELDKQFNEFVSPMEKQIENLVLENDNLTKIRDSLLPKLMFGKIVVNVPEEANGK
ncbi:restriction endonuclease subunit S [Methanobacterium sp. BAmetb5]|uniref:restriction endonuclease subunit S n=1 Tax=Methanobacterium sp. BAmetb5 TaxID=2025351 RepID=UPI000E834C65|nr:restriction endonuclease subunit S [Methanobacterium sp. BAmetb5]AXV40392.1 MAG: hypothetical protein CIT02_08700 [Methanobacterium sp. BAmetb5]